MCDGPILYCDESGPTRYQGWEELERMKANDAIQRVADAD